MRKLLALALVLGLATMASATSAVGGLELSVNGWPALEEYELPFPSGELILDIHLLPETLLGGFDLAVQVTGLGSLDAANVVFENMPLTEVYVFGNWMSGPRAWGGGDVAVIPPVETQFYRISTGNTDFNTLGEYTLMNNLLFHCDGEGDVLVELIAFDSTYYTHDEAGVVLTVDQLYDAGTVVDSIIVHQIPEPMTLSLLAMGGLALLRRRR